MKRCDNGENERENGALGVSCRGGMETPLVHLEHSHGTHQLVHDGGDDDGDDGDDDDDDDE